jgi:hypothetical protein
MSDELNFESLEPVSVPVTIAGEQYTLREASLATGIKLRDAHANAAIVQNGVVIGTRGTAGIEPTIISECLFDAEGKNVPVAKIRLWPDKVTSALFNKIRDLSGYSAVESAASLRQRLARLEQIEAQVGNSQESTAESSS